MNAKELNEIMDLMSAELLEAIAAGDVDLQTLAEDVLNERLGEAA